MKNLRIHKLVQGQADDADRLAALRQAAQEGIADIDAGPAIAGVLPNAIDESQATFCEVGFQRLLSRFVFRVAQLLGKRVPCGDESGTQGLALGHQLFKVWAKHADVHRERRFMVDDVVGFGEGLKKFGGQLAGHGDGLG